MNKIHLMVIFTLTALCSLLPKCFATGVVTIRTITPDAVIGNTPTRTHGTAFDVRVRGAFSFDNINTDPFYVAGEELGCKLIVDMYDYTVDIPEGGTGEMTGFPMESTLTLDENLLAANIDVDLINLNFNSTGDVYITGEALENYDGEGYFEDDIDGNHITIN